MSVGGQKFSEEEWEIVKKGNYEKMGEV